MSVNRIRFPQDFRAIAASALGNSAFLLARWLPDGDLIGDEWCSLNPRRPDRTRGSFKVNLSTGRWCDFATGDRGGDLISLYAFLHRTTQGEAARRVAQSLKGTLS